MSAADLFSPGGVDTPKNLRSFGHLMPFTYTTPEARRAWVGYRLRVLGKSVASISIDAGWDRSTANKAFARPYPEAEQLIADAVGLSRAELFPDRVRDENAIDRHHDATGSST